eukprot:CAMPEP_0115047412 /NCGR_PEP_ID=MMETSP0216-20121206/49286_1 /TAXON_ID=223996 /ORGANISM="Protocruzia adherens, Strain Boccale" /LENGTH=329 /DNA_ID=CAMNT_0002430593 /DNA_START=21 /DNA_END=1006 /DNA_ORIENTATION=+
MVTWSNSKIFSLTHSLWGRIYDFLSFDELLVFGGSRKGMVAWMKQSLAQMERLDGYEETAVMLTPPKEDKYSFSSIISSRRARIAELGLDQIVEKDQLSLISLENFGYLRHLHMTQFDMEINLADLLSRFPRLETLVAIKPNITVRSDDFIVLPRCLKKFAIRLEISDREDTYLDCEHCSDDDLFFEKHPVPFSSKILERSNTLKVCGWITTSSLDVLATNNKLTSLNLFYDKTQALRFSHLQEIYFDELEIDQWQEFLEMGQEFRNLATVGGYIKKIPANTQIVVLETFFETTTENLVKFPALRKLNVIPQALIDDGDVVDYTDCSIR